jgi:ABC-type dipeptide/oligopeptide/nickel transport system ATPase component
MSSILQNYETKNKRIIRNLKTVNDKLFSMDKFMRYMLIGPSGSGKSYLIKNLVLNPKMYKYFFDEIYLFIKSIDDQNEWEELIKDNLMRNKIKVISEFNQQDVAELFDELEVDSNKQKSPPNVLFVFDDMALDGLTYPLKKTIIDHIFIRGRHSHVSIIISSQVYKALNKNTRSLNANVITIFQGTKYSDLESIAEEHSTIYPKDKILDLFTKHLENKHDSITIDYTHEKVLFKDKNFNIINIDE